MPPTPVVGAGGLGCPAALYSRRRIAASRWSIPTQST